MNERYGFLNKEQGAKNKNLKQNRDCYAAIRRGGAACKNLKLAIRSYTLEMLLKWIFFKLFFSDQYSFIKVLN
jgi:hypothetical protein